LFPATAGTAPAATMPVTASAELKVRRDFLNLLMWTLSMGLEFFGAARRVITTLALSVRPWSHDGYIDCTALMRCTLVSAGCNQSDR
jgi:hypothetical protein